MDGNYCSVPLPLCSSNLHTQKQPHNRTTTATQRGNNQQRLHQARDTASQGQARALRGSSKLDLVGARADEDKRSSNWGQPIYSIDLLRNRLGKPTIRCNCHWKLPWRWVRSWTDLASRCARRNCVGMAWDSCHVLAQTVPK
jgi:hypothetical protein